MSDGELWLWALGHNVVLLENLSSETALRLSPLGACACKCLCVAAKEREKEGGLRRIKKQQKQQPVTGVNVRI